MYRYQILFSFLFLPLTNVVFAGIKLPKLPKNLLYVNAITSTAYYKSIDTVSIFSTLRLSYGLDLKYYNKNISANRSVQSIFSFKNFGIAERNASIRYRERMLTVGNQVRYQFNKYRNSRNYYVGLGIDYKVHFKHQHWFIGKYKHKHVLQDINIQKLVNPWQFYITAGLDKNRLGWHLEYYFTNFYNKDFTGNALSVMHKFKQANIINLKCSYRLL